MMSGVKRKRKSDTSDLKCTDGPSDMDKKSLFTIQNFVKEPSANGTTRLQSFRAPRDLSLGGTKPKKLYTPNLNVTRARNKPKDVPVKEVTRNVRTRGARSVAGNRNKFVQLQGVFSQGVGEARLRNGFSDNRASYRAHDMPVPKVRKREIKDRKREDGIVDDLLHDSGSDEETGDVYSPYEVTSDTFSRTYFPTKSEVKKVKEDFTGEFLKNEQYSESNVCLSLMKFPDSVPGRVVDGRAKGGGDVKLRNIPEGKIGKILIRQSGKMELHIGANIYDMGPMRSALFKQDIVSTVNENGRRKLGRIGNLDMEYKITPHWKQFLER